MKKISFIIFIGLQSLLAISQENAWDNTKARHWPSVCQKVEIISSMDQAAQSAIFYSGTGEIPRPLVVSLHTWSGDYTQEDPLVQDCIDKNYNYIHPDFRGPNNSPEACGSALVIRDIDDAISFAIREGNVDMQNIHIIGVSGGGYATLLAYMKSQMPVRSFSAWVPISDLVAWYGESTGRGNKYAGDIARSTMGMDFSSGDVYIDTLEAMKRSPLFMDTPVADRQHSKLYVYAGVHDGYTGSVPITQSLNFYNKVVRDFDPATSELIPEADIIRLLTARNYFGSPTDSLDGRPIHYRKTYRDLVKLTVFEGTHEQLTGVALDHIPSKNILAIGDSNGALEEGWVNQLKSLRFNDVIVNTCVPGNTIAYDNLEKESLNTMRNIHTYLDKGKSEMGRIDQIVIMLGTNDCKAVFSETAGKVPGNLDALLKEIKADPAYLASKPDILIVSPPPMWQDEKLLPKYYGGCECVANLNAAFRKVAKKNDCSYLDVHSILLPRFDSLAVDGVHLNAEGQMIIAKEIERVLE